MTFGRRLTVFTALAIAAVLVAGSAVVYGVQRNQLRGAIDRSLTDQSRRVFIVKGLPGLGFGARTTAPRLSNFAIRVPRPQFGLAPSFFELVDLRRGGKPRLLTPTGVTLPITARTIAVARTGRGAYLTDVTVRGTHLRMRVEPSGANRALLSARSLAEVDSALGRLAWILGITAGLGALLAALVGAAVARGALRPVRRLTVAAEHVAATHDLAAKIDVEGGDELARLGAAFNEMLDSLDGALRSQRQLVSDVSHELRTPLTTLRTNVDLLRQGRVVDPGDHARLVDDLSAEVDELTRLVANLVDLARGSQRELRLAPVALDGIVVATAARARARYPWLQVEVDAEPTTVWGDREQLERALWNLVENAAEWSEGERRIAIRVAGGEVTVRDWGPGVPASDRPFVFDRFYRSDAARGKPGSGLGLAIARQVAEGHGGRIELEDPAGGGALFHLSLIEAG